MYFRPGYFLGCQCGFGTHRGEKQVLKKKVPWEFMVGTQVYKYAVDIHGRGLPTTSDMQLF